jgi:hypothetical protein
MTIDEERCDDYLHSIEEEYDLDFTVPLCCMDLLFTDAEDLGFGDAVCHTSIEAEVATCEMADIHSDKDESGNYDDFYMKNYRTPQMQLSNFSKPRHFWADMFDSVDDGEDDGGCLWDVVEPEPEAC